MENGKKKSQAFLLKWSTVVTYKAGAQTGTSLHLFKSILHSTLRIISHTDQGYIYFWDTGIWYTTQRCCKHILFGIWYTTQGCCKHILFGVYNIWQKIIFQQVAWIWIGVLLNVLILIHIWKAFSLEVLELAEAAFHQTQ